MKSTPHAVPQAFSNITKPGYRSGPPSTVQQKELVKHEYMAHENISITNFLSIFGMASESCLNNIRVSSDQQEKLFDQFRATQDGPTREQLMLDISRRMPKDYADLVANFISFLTNLVLLSRDAYFHQAHPNLDAFRLRNLCSATISGGDLFDRTLMQEYEQHPIGFGVKSGSKKTTSTPTRNTRRAEVDSVSPLRVSITNQCQHPNTWCNSPFFPPHQGGRTGGRGGCRRRSHGSNTNTGKHQQPPQ